VLIRNEGGAAATTEREWLDHFQFEFNFLNLNLVDPPRSTPII
jgi:hypothetical protein